METLLDGHIHLQFIELFLCQHIEWTPSLCSGGSTSMTHPKLLDGLKCESKSEDNGKNKSWGTFLGSQHFEGKRVCWSFKMKLERLTRNSITHTDLHKLNNKLVSAYLEHFGAQTSHGQTQTQHDSNLGKPPPFPL